MGGLGGGSSAAHIPTMTFVPQVFVRLPRRLSVRLRSPFPPRYLAEVKHHASLRLVTADSPSGGEAVVSTAAGAPSSAETAAAMDELRTKEKDYKLQIAHLTSDASHFEERVQAEEEAQEEEAHRAAQEEAHRAAQEEEAHPTCMHDSSS